MSKKVIGALLALIMVLSVFSLSALAIGQYNWEPDAGKYKQTWGLADGGNGVVQVTLSTNYEVGPISFVIEGVTLDSVNPGNGYYAGSTIEYNKSTGLVFLYPATDAALKAQSLNNAVVATFTYKGNATPAIKNNPKQNTATGMNGTLIAARCSGEYVNSSDFYVGQTCEILAFGQAPKPSETAVLAKAASAEAGVLIDTTHTFGGAYTGVVYGFTQKAANTFMNTNYLANNFEATNGGSISFTRASYAKTGNGTGTVITVKNADGTEAAKYVVVIFGDVDGNGLINANDTGEVQKAVASATYFANNSVQRMAANCQNVAAAAMMHTINANDTGVVQNHVGGKSIDQNALATKMASLTAQYK